LAKSRHGVLSRFASISEGARMNPVPDRYRGVWARTLLETPQLKDDSTFVRWVQTSLWHADLRVPQGLTRSSSAPQLATQQGFCGVTEVSLSHEGEVCTWHRKTDFQPPRREVDAGWMVFENPERVIETGVHAPYREIWQRLPDSTGRFIVLGRLDAQGQLTTERFLVSGNYAISVRPRQMCWPVTTGTSQSLEDLLRANPAIASELLDFEISFGWLGRDGWSIERSTVPELSNTKWPLTIHNLSDTRAVLEGARWQGQWSILEWSCIENRLLFA
jgi:hypothetical protein